MKNILRPASSILLPCALLLSMLAVQGVHFVETKAKPIAIEPLRANVDEKTDPQAAKRVNELKRLNKDVRNSLKMFEDNEPRTKHRPKIEDSWIVTGKASSRQARKNCKNCSPLTKVSFRAQDLVLDTTVEMIFVPTYSAPGQWQGTVIANRYDEAGTFLQQYVADVVIVERPAGWSGIYEVSFEGGSAWLESDPALGMITDTSFVLGMPVEEQPQLIPMALGSRHSWFQNASLAVPQVGCCMPIGIRGVTNPRIRNWSVCAASICVGMGGVGCGVASLLGNLFPACAAGACSGGATVCAFRQIFGT